MVLKNILLTIGIIGYSALSCVGESKIVSYPIEPVPFTAVSINDIFWSPRLDATKNVTLPLAFAKCKESGRFLNFVNAALPDSTYSVDCNPYDDTDVYKIIEGASYLLQTYPDSRLEEYLDSIISLIAAAQAPDGYLMTAYTMNPVHPHPWIGSQRWGKVEELSHEFYNLGHLIESAVAHYKATGKRSLLDIAIKFADCVCREIGCDEGKLDRVPGHQIVEMALVKLFIVTRDNKYLEQAKYFLERRGKTSRTDIYSQAHKAILEQEEAVGHAVRALYMYSGMADVASLTGDSCYIHAIDRIWDNIVSKKIYITGGIGARHEMESFGDNYELPNHEAYCETCASVGNIFLNHRLFLLHGDGCYYDILERTLYNSLLSGISLEGDTFFYPNPLASEGGYSRKSWFGTACCPSNLCRFLPSLPGYIYATKGKDLFVNLYISNTADIELQGKSVKLKQSGDYVWQGKISIEVEENLAGKFNMKLRVPGWVQNNPLPGDLYSYADMKHPKLSVRINGKIINTAFVYRGYISIDREWEKGDRIDIDFDIMPRVVKANPNLTVDRGKIAIERGPLVYCAEWPDNNYDLNTIEAFSDGEIVENYRDKLKGIIELSTVVRPLSGENGKANLTLIPYYAWANRGAGQMAVWLSGCSNDENLGDR